MAAARMPSAVEWMRLPASDRALRLRWLVRWHREQAAGFDAAKSPMGVTRHQNRLRRVMAVAMRCGVEGIADA